MTESGSWPYGDYWRASRLRPALAGGAAGLWSREAALLAVAGVLAACAVTFLPTPIRAPGHAILKATLPIVAGVALAPRLWAGSLCGAAAAASTGLMLGLGLGNLQPAAVAALLAIGPAIDLAMRGAGRGGWTLYLRFALAGLAANLFAFAVRWGVAWLALDGARLHTMQQIGPGALASFALCGLAAGLVSGVLCFRGAAPPE
ncbi:hypothetical protein Pla175_32440 [Pirellulimonas nuda]|uniref:Thiamine transporter protein (Thia_YuaJ) n=1 Tax=Pirellulimonas nuda TaxID=2528009 RepID=A0A518DEE3_9BACT|nr:hypothetical protein [Pirellulimonas nuda]QDU89848.1 hypothetical protein Pla175_32440 [Pirellulimonas nuda]